jgi:hypothetical protein
MRKPVDKARKMRKRPVKRAKKIFHSVVTGQKFNAVQGEPTSSLPGFSSKTVGDNWMPATRSRSAAIAESDGNVDSFHGGTVVMRKGKFHRDSEDLHDKPRGPSIAWLAGALLPRLGRLAESLGGVEKDLPPGEKLVACFRPFLENLVGWICPPRPFRRITLHE